MLLDEDGDICEGEYLGLDEKVSIRQIQSYIWVLDEKVFIRQIQLCIWVLDEKVSRR